MAVVEVDRVEPLVQVAVLGLGLGVMRQGPMVLQRMGQARGIHLLVRGECGRAVGMGTQSCSVGS